jgi:GntR family transcriptional regulator
MTPISASWTIEFHSGIPVYRQIIHHVQAAVADGRLRESDQLPTVRALQRALNVNPNTVVKAYRELEHLGVISTAHGSGCFVAPSPASPRLPARERKAMVAQLCARFTAEARSHGIAVETLVQHLTQPPSHA